MTENIKIFTPKDLPADERAIAQLRTCMRAGDAVDGVLAADHHVGYSQPIGGAIAFPDHISPSGVGYDIGCGNKAVATSLLYSDIRDDLGKIMDEIAQRISFGLGRPNNEPVDHPVFDRINRDAPLPGIRDLLGLARTQLGTVGGGNHYVDLFREEGTDRVWIGVHFGSRGFGHKTAKGFLALAQGKGFGDKVDEGEMDSPPVLLHKDSALGHMYIEAMNIAGEYAYAGRDTVVDKVLEILGNPGVFAEVHNHHNFAWEEDVWTKEGPYSAWVVRKGCTPLWPNQQGFVGGSMGENAVIIRGLGLDAMGGLDKASDALHSAPHGAGRVMSRTEAAGKSKKRWYCRSCDWVQGVGEAAPKEDHCPQCASNGNLGRKQVITRQGRVDWMAVKKDLALAGIELRGGAADEAPEAYKNLPAVLEAHRDHITVDQQLQPIGVVMAGSDVFDPFKD